MRVFSALPLLACLLLASGAAHAWVSSVPDVVLYTLPSLASPLQAATRLFTRRTGVAVHLLVAPPAGLVGLIAHRARVDVVVADTATIGAMRSQGLAQPQGVALGTDAFILVGDATGSGTRATVLPDPTTAASFDGHAILRQGHVDGAIRGVADTPDVLEAVRQDPTLAGLVLRTDLRTGTMRQLAALPVPPLAIEAAAVRLGQSGAAPALLAFLGGPEARGALHAAGLEPPP